MIKKSAITILSAGILLAAWQLFAVVVQLPELIPTVPRLLKVLAELFVSGSFYLSVAATLVRGIAGILLSLVAATGVAYLFGRHELLYELFRPLLAIMRSVPVISFILLALIFLNPENIPLIIAFITMFPLLTENLTKGIRNQRKELMMMARTFRVGWWNRLTQVIYPQLIPFLYSGLASASGFGWRAIIMGEVLAQCNLGIGSEMKRAQTFIAVPELMAWTIIAILISIAFDKGIARIAGLQPRVHYIIRHRQTASFTATQDIRLTDISYRYENRPVLSHFNFQFVPGRIYGIAAPSGRGKTTLLNLIGNMLKPDQGQIEPSQPDGIAIVFQEPELIRTLTAAENIALPLAAFMDRQVAMQQASALLQDMELETLGERYPSELSFGQQQRVAIARALAYPSPLLLMDEPFKGLDEMLCRRIIGRLRDRQAQNGQTILFASHQSEELRLLADEVVRL